MLSCAEGRLGEQGGLEARTWHSCGTVRCAKQDGSSQVLFTKSLTKSRSRRAEREGREHLRKTREIQALLPKAAQKAAHFPAILPRNRGRLARTSRPLTPTWRPSSTLGRCFPLTSVLRSWPS